MVGSKWDRLGENIVFGRLSWKQIGAYFQPPEGQKGNTGLKEQLCSVGRKREYTFAI